MKNDKSDSTIKIY